MGYYGWRPYVPVAEKRRQAERKLATLKKQRRSVTPVTIEGRTIAKSFWGKSWCINLERYSDYENRLARGRTYLRSGLVVDLQIKKGEIAAMVAGSSLYKVRIAIAPVPAARWKAICRDCAGTVDSLVELLQGRLSKGVMDRVCRTGDGLFPSPGEIKLSCSCPDWADMWAPRKIDLFRARDLDGGATCWLRSEGQKWVSLVSSISASAIAVSMPRRTRWFS